MPVVCVSSTWTTIGKAWFASNKSDSLPVSARLGYGCFLYFMDRILGTAEGGGFWESVVQIATWWFEDEAVGMRTSTFKSDAVVVSY